MSPADSHVEDISHSRHLKDQARNEKQKAVLLREAARISQQRVLRTARENRKQCDRAAQSLASRRPARKPA